MSDGDIGDERAREGASQGGGVASVTVLTGRGREPRPLLEPHRPAETVRAAGALVTFDRHELREIFNLYGRRVAEGEWRDYAIDFRADKAVFSIYRRASEVPLYRVEKDPALARRQGAYAVVAATGLILKRGPDLARVLQVLDRRPKLVVV